jgi:hypothetical protein
MLVITRVSLRKFDSYTTHMIAAGGPVMRYKMDEPTVAITDGGFARTKIVTIPQGAILTITDGVAFKTLPAYILLDAEYDGGHVRVFLGDVLKRASLVPAEDNQTA